MWKVIHESKIQLVSCEISPKYLLGLSMLEEIRAIDAYIFCDSFHSVFFPILPQFSPICTYKFSTFPRSSELYFPIYPGLENLKSSDPPNHIWSTYLDFNCYVQFVCFRVALIEIWIELTITLSLIYCFTQFSYGCYPPQLLHLEWAIFALTGLSIFKWSTCS